jgi:hypothetical protein
MLIINEINIIMSTIGTTSIDSLPMSPQSEHNIQMQTYEKNVQIQNFPQEGNYSRDVDPTLDQKHLNQFVTGLQQASAAGMTSLPSRDIPQNQQHIIQDVHTKPNYIPQNETIDYIQQHQTNEEIINSQALKQEKKNVFDSVFDEFQIPILIGVLYFLFQLPVVEKQLAKILPSLFKKDGNPSLSGYIFTSVAFSCIYYFIMKGMLFLEK